MKRGRIERRSPLRQARTATGRAPKPRKPAKRLKRAAMDSALREGVYGRAGACCDRCGRFIHPDVWECHHRQLRSRGGKDSWANLVALCGVCHGWVHANPAEATRDGWMVASWADPVEAPLFLHGRVWVLAIAAGWVIHGRSEA